MSSLNDFIGAVSAQESGGNYRAVNPNSGALGRYQVMPANVPYWAKRYLGINLTASQFLNSPKMQDRLVNAVLGDYVKRYGYRGAASAWYSGNPALASNYNPQKWGPSIGAYVDQVMDRMDEGGFTLNATAATEGIVAKMTRPQAPRASLTSLEPVAEQQGGSDSDPLSIILGDESEVTQGVGLDIDPETAQEKPAPAGIETSFGPIDGPSPPPGFNDDKQRPNDTGLARSTGRDSLVLQGVNLGSSIGMRNPLPGFKITFGFGAAYGSRRTAGSHHRGVDFAAPEGTRVRAPEGGRIISAGWEDSGFGLAIRYQAADGTYGILGHLSELGNLEPGMAFKAGTYLGRVGTTGDSSGDHLHWEKRRDLYTPSTAYDFTDSIAW